MRLLALALVVAAGLVLVHAHAVGPSLADPICVDTNPVSVLGRQVFPATHHCTPTARGR